MRTVEQERHANGYALGRTREEYERLRGQARGWETATGRVLDEIGLAPGARCLDAGCGPGETMRLMAQRVGPAGSVLGIDVDAELGADAVATLHASGHRQCRFQVHDVRSAASLPAAPFDLVYARLLLFHLPDRVAVLRRLWNAVAPGGHLVVQDYDIAGVRVLPTLQSVDEAMRVLAEAFIAVGCDVHAGVRLPQLFVQAGIGSPDGTDVAGRLEPLATGRLLVEHTFRSVLPTALEHGITTEPDATATLSRLDRDAGRFADRPLIWPLLVGAWKQRDRA